MSYNKYAAQSNGPLFAYIGQKLRLLDDEEDDQRDILPSAALKAAQIHFHHTHRETLPDGAVFPFFYSKIGETPCARNSRKMSIPE